MTTYKDAGVDIDAGNESVKRIKKMVTGTFSKSVLSGLGTFGALYDLTDILKEYRNPVLVQSIDGVGTKIKIARMMNKFYTIGMDLVNHSVNDILCQGARPLTFLDYIASSKLEPKIVKEIVSGICRAAKLVKLSVVGGETAEMPGVYEEGEIDLVGCITGIVEKKKIITGKDIIPGDIIIGLGSSGLHTNGYSLARKVLLEVAGFKLDEHIDLGPTLGEQLLTPHKCYLKSVLPAIKMFNIKGIAHITGGGFEDNIKRILPENTNAIINTDSWCWPSIFQYIQSAGKVEFLEMYRVFNLGIGMILVISPEDKVEVCQELKKHDKTLQVYKIGEITKGKNEIFFKE